jgi:hypothetical protein
MTPTMTFTCSICGEASVSICTYCTKDACPNHLCERCSRCSDCCECDIRLEEHPEMESTHLVEAHTELAAEVAEPATPPDLEPAAADEKTASAEGEPINEAGVPPSEETEPSEPAPDPERS